MGVPSQDGMPSCQAEVGRRKLHSPGSSAARGQDARQRLPESRSEAKATSGCAGCVWLTKKTPVFPPHREATRVEVVASSVSQCQALAL